jgi:glycosyltransferase involved in cell wall biosynthesis
MNLAKWTLASFEAAVLCALRRLPEAPDALYAHFVYPSGLTAGKNAKSLSIPAFMAYGESSPKLFSFLGREEIARRLKGLSGVVAVSGENAREIVADGYYPFPERVKVFPNGVDPAEFSPMDRAEARKALGLPPDKFIVAFVGGFIERKGVSVLSRALDEAGVSSVFIGRGPVAPTAREILYQGALDHGEIPKVLAAADVFALPTLNEGCCNAIVEALAMGLPVISSDRPFNDELLTDENALRIDPTDAHAVAEAIRRLKDDAALRARLAEGARRTGASLEIHARAAGILRFMEERL